MKSVKYILFRNQLINTDKINKENQYERVGIKNFDAAPYNELIQKIWIRIINKVLYEK